MGNFGRTLSYRQPVHEPRQPSFFLARVVATEDVLVQFTHGLAHRAFVNPGAVELLLGNHATSSHQQVIEYVLRDSATSTVCRSFIVACIGHLGVGICTCT